MRTAPRYRSAAGPRDRLYFGRPDLWPLRPFLALSRQPLGEPLELGVMFDAVGVSNTYGYSSAVFFTNVFDLPPTVAEVFALPRVVYDTLDELAADGWVVD